MIQVPYTDFSVFLRRFFSGKVQKISVNAGFSCPNRDGTVGWGGCTYCNNQTFNPEYCSVAGSVTEQLQRGISFFSRKYPSMKYLAYFQAYTNTYGDMDRLCRLYEEALSVDGVVGLVVGTRPDCVSDALLDYFALLHRRCFVLLEYGVESVNDVTLTRVNRGHTYACSAAAIYRTASRGIPVGAHMILGLPGESKSDILRQPVALSALPLNTLKLHQLQLVRGTRMANDYIHYPEEYHIYNVEEYVSLVADYLERLRPDIVVERFTSQSPKSLLIAPDWGLKNYEFVELVKREMQRRNSWQGKFYQEPDNNPEDLTLQLRK